MTYVPHSKTAKTLLDESDRLMGRAEDAATHDQRMYYCELSKIAALQAQVHATLALQGAS